MKRLNMKTIYLSFLIILLFATSAYSAADWVKYNRDDHDCNVSSYMKGKIRKDRGKHIVQVWDKMVYSNKGREKYIQSRGKNGLSTQGWDKLANVQCLFEIDCKKRTIQMLSIIQYDMDDRVLHSGSYHQPIWNYIIPDSDGDNLRKKVCQ